MHSTANRVYVHLGSRLGHRNSLSLCFLSPPWPNAIARHSAAPAHPTSSSLPDLSPPFERLRAQGLGVLYLCFQVHWGKIIRRLFVIFERDVPKII